MGNVIVEKTVEIDRFVFGRRQGKENVRVAIELPLPLLSRQEEAELPMPIQTLVAKAIQPVVDSLAYYLAALQYSGELGPMVGIPTLQRHLTQAAKEMNAALRVAQQAEDNPPFFRSDN